MVTNIEWKIHKVLNDYCTVYAVPARGSVKPLTALCECMKLLDSGKRIIFIEERTKGEINEL